jgi:hypothetical protein
MNNIYRPFHRPASSCTLPRGVAWEYVEAPAEFAPLRTDIPRSKFRFGIIKTDRPLTQDECEHFSLQLCRADGIALYPEDNSSADEQDNG